MALNLDTDGFRRAGELVDTAGQVLGGDFGSAAAQENPVARRLDRLHWNVSQLQMAQPHVRLYP